MSIFKRYECMKVQFYDGKIMFELKAEYYLAV